MRRELIDFIQKVINKLDDSNGPAIQIKAITSTKLGSPILELNSPEAANWLKDPARKSRSLNISVARCKSRKGYIIW